jgi:hypothetical protein
MMMAMKHDAQSGLEAATDLDPVDGQQDFEAQPLGTDHRGDDHHGQGHHGGLIDANHDGGPRQGQLDLEQDLPVTGPERMGRFHHAGGHFPYAHVGQPDDRRHGVDNGGEQCRHFTQAEEHQGRDQIDKAGHGLHAVQERLDDRLEGIAAGHENAEGMPMARETITAEVTSERVRMDNSQLPKAPMKNSMRP